jgi:hypothetical protein
LRGKCAKVNPNTDDILDYPNLYAGRVVTLEGRVDDIFSPTTFAMQDNYDLVQDDRILMISVMPVGAKSTTTTTTSLEATTDDQLKAVPAVEMVQLLQNSFQKHKIIRATGTVAIFDRAALEQEYGAIDFGSTPLEKFEKEPVILLGAREFAQFQQHRVEQQAAVIPPPPPAREATPAPEPEVAPPAAEPEAAPPAAQPEATAPSPSPGTEPAAETSRLPTTASPIPLLGLTGLLALLAGFGIRARRP